MATTHQPEAFRRAAHRAVDWIADYLADPGRYPVSPSIEPGELIDRLPAGGPEAGEPLDVLLGDFVSEILPAVTHWNHPRFFNFFACTGSAPGILAEMLAAALNTNGLNWVASPAVAELEQVAANWLRDWMGLAPDYFGIIYDTASVSTLHAIAAARDLADPESRTRGVTRNMTVYCSEQAHSSIDKAVIGAGLGQANLRRIPVDAEYRMLPSALAAALNADIAAGRSPCAIVATIGTTSTTSVDPLPEIAEIAQRHSVWLHVDAAYAGAAAILPEMQHILDGSSRAHSLVVNPHKWLFTPMDCSLLYTRFPEALRRAFALTPEYLRTHESPRAVNLMDYGVPLGRRFRALKLWFVLKHFGRTGLCELLRGHIAMAQHLAENIGADSRFEIMAPHPFSAVCFRLRGGDQRNREIVARINAGGEFFLSQTLLRGEFCLRVAIGNLLTSQDDVDRLWRTIQAFA